MGMESARHNVFLTGGTGYMGSRLARLLLARGHQVKALTRIPSVQNLPPEAHPVFGSALGEDYAKFAPGSDTFVHLVGVSHPSPAKAAEFRSIDLVALRAAVNVAKASGIQHFVFVSVAHPAPAMKAYIEARMECEQIIGQSGLNTTILRPWYVLGPGHRWPYALLPVYWLMERISATRESAMRLGLVTLEQMLAALAGAVEHPATGVRILGVPEIRQAEPTVLQPAPVPPSETGART
jgi:uncharacterized protein YbjT (DUF2867 family)